MTAPSDEDEDEDEDEVGAVAGAESVPLLWLDAEVELAVAPELLVVIGVREALAEPV